MKRTKFISLLLNLLFISTPLYADDDLFDQSLESILDMDSELKAELGTRDEARNILEARSPVDVITFDQIERTGLSSLTNVLRYFIAGFNAPETSVADGSDHVRLTTLRGMSPDQVLVLVNGKRLHTSSLLYVNGVIGRGTSGVDFDTIAVKSIERIEVLRDGAAAQYGSDAIAGVINIVLKGIGHQDSMTFSAGQRDEGDGEQLYVDGFISFPLSYEGFVNVTVSVIDQQQTQRAGTDKRLTPAIVSTHVGIPDSESLQLALNAEIPQKTDLTFYTNALFNYRDSKASAFFRVPDPDREIFPDGYLPMINATIMDYSLTAGMNGQLNDGYFWDLSNVYGYNSFEFNVTDSINQSLGALSPTSFDNGELSFIQNTTNLDINKNFGNLGLAAGLEYRYEQYQIKQGEFASYVGTGSQGFAGFKPENATNRHRSNYALYINASHKFTHLSLEGAARFEDYSDFGSTTNAKVAMGYKIIPQLLLRASASTGFRAPSLAQTSYSQTSSFADTVTNKLSTQGTFTPSHEVSQALGAKELTPESSKHLTIGAVYQPIQNLSLMVDYFSTKVDDRISLSNEQEGTTTAQIEQLKANNVTKARFFTNALKTQTKGIDVKIDYMPTLEGDAKLKMSFWYNYSDNKLIDFNDDTLDRDGSFEQIVRLENGQPKSNIRFLTHYQLSKVELTMNISEFGGYNQVINNVSYPFDSAWTVDLDAKYKLSNAISISLGANNIFGEQPNKWKNLSGDIYATDGIKPYSRYSPFGYSGAYYYLQTSIGF
ncbi:TonB-dependent receptor plug domain-containing protein [Thalassotalea sp. PLHSN55]|uniref:TonB-dependent receptor plug domain-containing protein n=1 Tax=Thalassotalea sp. PLHSN55 TaxID=3435888 RepID=UPI003F8545AE